MSAYKISSTELIEVAYMLSKGYTQVSISELYGVTPSTISNIKRGKRNACTEDRIRRSAETKRRRATVNSLLDNTMPVPETGCLIWMGAVSSGYGVLSVEGKTRKAHRVSYEQNISEIPEGMCVCHKCDTPLCVNPTHLFVGTTSDNIADMDKKGRRHVLRGTSASNAQLTDADVRDIRRSSKTYNELAALYGVSNGCINHIKNNRTWRHVHA